MAKKLDKLRTEVRNLLFEDSYVTHGTIDNLRAGTGLKTLEQNPLDLPIDPGPQMANQLSVSEPPVNDPNYIPADNRELAHALSALAKDLPNEMKMVQNVYEKFKKFVEDNKNLGIQVSNKVEKNSPDEIQEARQIVRDFLSKNLKEVMASKEEDENTLSTIAKELGVSVSGVKRLEMEALGKAKLFSVHFPDDEMSVKKLAMKYFVDALSQLDLIEPEDAQDLMSNEESYELASFRYFLWDAFMKNVYKKMLRDASTQGLPESQLGKLKPGLYDRAKDYIERLPFDRVLKSAVTSLSSAE